MYVFVLWFIIKSMFSKRVDNHEYHAIIVQVKHPLHAIKKWIIFNRILDFNQTI